MLSTGKLQTLQKKKSALATIGHSTVVSSEITSRKCGRIRFKLTNGKFKLFDFTMKLEAKFHVRDQTVAMHKYDQQLRIISRD